MFASLPLLGTIAAGWPSPAEEETSEVLRIDEWLITDKNSTVMVEMSGYAMQDAGILHGDLVLIQRGRLPQAGDIVIAKVDGDWLIRYYHIEHKEAVLYPANGAYDPLKAKEELVVMGVITGVVRKYH